jgi:hypothetical protein
MSNANPLLAPLSVAARELLAWRATPCRTMTQIEVREGMLRLWAACIIAGSDATDDGAEVQSC